MNRKQCFTLAWAFIIIGMIFIGIDMSNNHCLNTSLEIETIQIMRGIVNEPMSIGDIWCVVNSEMYEPFITLSYLLGIVFMVMGFLEKKE